MASEGTKERCTDPARLLSGLRRRIEAAQERQPRTEGGRTVRIEFIDPAGARLGAEVQLPAGRLRLTQLRLRLPGRTEWHTLALTDEPAMGT